MKDKYNYAKPTAQFIVNKPLETGLAMTEEAIKKALDATDENLKIFGIGKDQQGRVNVRFIRKGYQYFHTGYPSSLPSLYKIPEGYELKGRAIDILAFFYLAAQDDDDPFLALSKELMDVLSDLEESEIGKIFTLRAQPVEGHPDQTMLALFDERGAALSLS